MIPTPRLGWSVATNIISPRLAIGSHTSDSCLVNMMKMMEGVGKVQRQCSVEDTRTEVRPRLRIRYRIQSILLYVFIHNFLF